MLHTPVLSMLNGQQIVVCGGTTYVNCYLYDILKGTFYFFLFAILRRSDADNAHRVGVMYFIMHIQGTSQIGFSCVVLLIGLYSVHWWKWVVNMHQSVNLYVCIYIYTYVLVLHRLALNDAIMLPNSIFENLSK